MLLGALDDNPEGGSEVFEYSILPVSLFSVHPR
jgi:hypothetical protein